MSERFVPLHCRLLVRQSRGGPSVLRRPAHRLLLRHRPEMPSPSALQRFGRVTCAWPPRRSALWRSHACTANCRPYTLPVSSRPNPAVKRRPNGGRPFMLREVQRRRWAPLTSTLGQMQMPIGLMSERFVALHCQLLLRQGRGGPSVLRRPAHRLLLRHRPEMPCAPALQRFRVRPLCLAAVKCLRRSALMFSRPSSGSTLSRSAAGLTRMALTLASPPSRPRVSA